ncbi:hypothetical protein [Chloroflexus sp.]|nr:hypothetical protein [Chloroflexus sp.]
MNLIPHLNDATRVVGARHAVPLRLRQQQPTSDSQLVHLVTLQHDDHT